MLSVVLLPWQMMVLPVTFRVGAWPTFTWMDAESVRQPYCETPRAHSVWVPAVVQLMVTGLAVALPTMVPPLTRRQPVWGAVPPLAVYVCCDGMPHTVWLPAMAVRPVGLVTVMRRMSETVFPAQPLSLTVTVRS